MPGVFINYRRDDTKGFTGSLSRMLKQRIGTDQVFMDIKDIKGGSVFPDVLRKNVESSNVLLVLIGLRWLDKDSHGKRRIDDPKDFVRQEIALALKRGVHVIPILVDGAEMPTTEQLPSDLQDLALLNALELSNSHWDEDLARIIDNIHDAMYAVGVEKSGTVKLAADFSPLPPMTSLIKSFVLIALGIGLVFSVIAIITAVNQIRFDSIAIHTEAEVIALHKISSDSGYSYRPEFQFVTKAGETTHFQSSLASNPPSYKIGERAQILYDPTNPTNAIIDSFMGRMWVTTIIGGLGALGIMIGVIPMLIRQLRSRKYRKLFVRGKPIITKFHSVEKKSNIEIQGRNPYVILSEWRNPISKELVHFRSHQLWDDPTKKAKNRMITVVVDPNNFHRYMMDLSFLKGTSRSNIKEL